MTQSEHTHYTSSLPPSHKPSPVLPLPPLRFLREPRASPPPPFPPESSSPAKSLAIVHLRSILAKPEAPLDVTRRPRAFPDEPDASPTSPSSPRRATNASSVDSLLRRPSSTTHTSVRLYTPPCCSHTLSIRRLA